MKYFTCLFLFLVSLECISQTTISKSIAVTYNKEGSFFQKNSAPLITGTMTLLGILVTLIVARNTIKSSTRNLNNQLKLQSESFEKQMKMQVLTTIQKEWLQNVRTTVSDYLEPTSKLWNATTVSEWLEKPAVNLTHTQQQELAGRMLHLKDRCRILLNINNPLEKNIIDKINQIHNVFNFDLPKGTTIEMGRYIEELYQAVHQLSDSFKPTF